LREYPRVGQKNRYQMDWCGEIAILIRVSGSS
jgi:hypothetical protein